MAPNGVDVTGLAPNAMPPPPIAPVAAAPNTGIVDAVADVVVAAPVLGVPNTKLGLLAGAPNAPTAAAAAGVGAPNTLLVVVVPAVLPNVALAPN
jgi:hypothetical protein